MPVFFEDPQQVWLRAHPQDEGGWWLTLEWFVLVRLHDEPRWVAWPLTLARAHQAYVAECSAQPYPGALMALRALEDRAGAPRSAFRYWAHVQWHPQRDEMRGMHVTESFTEPDVTDDDGLLGPFSTAEHAALAARALASGEECLSHYAPPEWL